MVTNVVIPEINLKGDVTRCFSLAKADRLSQLCISGVLGNNAWQQPFGFLNMDSFSSLCHPEDS